jgi:hypothetical protein
MLSPPRTVGAEDVLASEILASVKTLLDKNAYYSADGEAIAYDKLGQTIKTKLIWKISKEVNAPITNYIYLFGPDLPVMDRSILDKPPSSIQVEEEIKIATEKTLADFSKYIYVTAEAAKYRSFLHLLNHIYSELDFEAKEQFKLKNTLSQTQKILFESKDTDSSPYSNYLLCAKTLSEFRLKLNEEKFMEYAALKETDVDEITGCASILNQLLIKYYSVDRTSSIANDIRNRFFDVSEFFEKSAWKLVAVTTAIKTAYTSLDDENRRPLESKKESIVHEKELLQNNYSAQKTKRSLDQMGLLPTGEDFDRLKAFS